MYQAHVALSDKTLGEAMEHWLRDKESETTEQLESDLARYAVNRGH